MPALGARGGASGYLNHDHKELTGARRCRTVARPRPRAGAGAGDGGGGLARSTARQTRTGGRDRLRRFLRGALLDRGIALALLAGLCLLRLWDPAPVEGARVKLFDLYQNLRPSRNAERPVIIVDIDEPSLKAHGQWPWPRSLVARLVDRLAEHGVAAIGFDVLFPEPDRQSPAEYAAGNPELPEAVRDALRGLPSNDARLAESFSRVPVVLAMALLGVRAGGTTAGIKAAPVAIRGADPRPHLLGASGALVNVPVLQAAARGAGLITHNPETDGVVRRVSALYRVGEGIQPGLAVELIRVATGGRTLVAVTGPDGVERIVFSGADSPNVEVPTDRRARFWVRFSPHDPGRYVSARDVLAGTVPRDRLEGRLILVGSSASGLLDIRSTPLDRQIPGVEVHAMLIENILFQDHIRRPFYADAVEFFVTLVLALLLIAVLPALGAARTMISGLAAVGLVIGGAWLMFTGQGLLFDLSFPVATALLVFIALTFTNYFREERARHWVRGAFARYLSPQVVAQLASQPDRLHLGGEMRDMTILFSDIRGFTTISEKLDAAGLTQFMNRYLTPMTDAILTARGTVDKYMGDAIMAFWNAPLDDPDHARNACRAALAMQARLATLNAELAQEAAAEGRGHIPVTNGIGINSAICCVGNMGSQQRFDYSVLGDGVNLTSRLEGQTKYYGVGILIGEETRTKAPEFAALEVDLVRVKGKREPTRIYVLLGDAAAAQEAWFTELCAKQADFLAAYRGLRWDEARAALDAVRAAAGGRLDGPCAMFAARIEGFATAPPPPDWDGVYEALTK